MNLVLDNYTDLNAKLLEFDGFPTILAIAKNDTKRRFYLTGGAIRNYISSPQLPFKDLDIFYSGKLELSELELLEKQGRMSKTPFGSIRWFPEKSDKYFDLVSFSEVKLTDQASENIDDILKQFDVTVNAIGFDVVSNNFYDPVGGHDDIFRKLIKIIRYDFSDEFISADCQISLLSTLWFRSLHFASALNFEIDKDSLNWISDNAWRKKYLNEFERHFFLPDLSIVEKLNLI